MWLPTRITPVPAQSAWRSCSSPWTSKQSSAAASERNVERVVASQRGGDVGCQLRPERVDGSVESERLLDVPEGRDQPGFPSRPESRVGSPQSAQQGGAPRRPEDPEHRQKQFEQDELPAEDPAHEPIRFMALTPPSWL